MFTPSSVMLIDALRQAVDRRLSRLPPGVVTPGRNVTKSSALRLVSGSLVIWLVLIVVEIVDDCVWMISDDDDTTTCSVEAADFEHGAHVAPARRT